jgi:hypothetical protein
MPRKSIRMAAQMGMAAGIFAGGWLCGATMQRPVEAQMGDIMKQAGQAAGAQGGALGAAGQLATSITSLQQNVTELQKDVDGLKKIQAMLGG